MTSILDESIIDAAELTGAARTALTEYERNRFKLAGYFPSSLTMDVIAQYNSGGRGLAKAADFRAYDVEPDVGDRYPVARKTIELPPIGHKLLLSEYENLRLKNNGDEIIRGVFDDVRSVVESVAARVELARGDALVNGSITWTGGLTGIPDADFGRTTDHETSASASWGTSTTDILGDIIAVKETYTDTNGFEPDTMLVSSQTLVDMLANDGIRAQAWAGLATSGDMQVSKDQLNMKLVGLGLPMVDTYDAKVDVAGTPTRVLSEDFAIFLPPANMPAGETVWGSTLEATEVAMLSGGEAPGIVAFTEVTTRTPIQVWTHAAARVIPILKQPDYTYALDIS